MKHVQSNSPPKTSPSIRHLHKEFLHKSSSPRQLTLASLARCKSEQEKFNALITLLDNAALADSTSSELRYQTGVSLSGLDGIPVVVKDFFDTASIPTTAGFRHFSQRIPAADAVMVSRLKALGAIILGKSNMDCFGSATTGLTSDFGPVRNPLNAQLIAGGSSCGSAASVAAGHAFLSIDTDAAGSARLPAACCGISAFKPSYGALSLDGVLAGEPATPEILMFSHVALQARTVDDLACSYHALKGLAYDDNAGQPVSPSVTVGVATDAHIHPSMEAPWRHTLEQMKRMGWKISQAHIGLADAKFQIEGIENARDGIDAIAFARCDLIALPTLTAPVPTVLEVQRGGPMSLDNSHVFWANYYGLPAVSMMNGQDATGHPFSFQLIGKAQQDVQVLSFARDLERFNNGGMKTKR